MLKLLNGGTQESYLTHSVQTADILLVFDAPDYGLPASLLKRVSCDVDHLEASIMRIGIPLQIYRTRIGFFALTSMGVNRNVETT